MHERSIPNLFVQSAAGGNHRQAEYLWDLPLPWLGYETPHELWDAGGPLLRTAVRQSILEAYMSQRARPSRMPREREPLADVPIIQTRRFAPPTGNGKSHRSRALPMYRI